MKTEILLLLFCLLHPKTEVATNSTPQVSETKEVVAEARIDMFSPLFLIEF